MDTYYIGIYNISQTSTSYSQEVKCNFTCPYCKKCIVWKITHLFLLYLSTICYIKCSAQKVENLFHYFLKSFKILMGALPGVVNQILEFYWLIDWCILHRNWELPKMLCQRAWMWIHTYTRSSIFYLVL